MNKFSAPVALAFAGPALAVTEQEALSSLEMSN